MTKPTFMGADGKLHKPNDADYLEARVEEIAHTVSELTGAVAALQHRVDALDARGVDWPGEADDRGAILPAE